MRRFLIATFLMILIPTGAYASVGFSSLLPNPAGDDTLGEYIELRNTGCESVDISSYTLSDASGKSYTLPVVTRISSHESMRFSYATTKIALNNSGDETVYLRDNSGNLVSSHQYSGTQRDDVIVTLPLTDEVCESMTPPVSSGSVSSSGVLSPSGSGESLSGALSPGSTGSLILTGSEAGSGEISSLSGETSSRVVSSLSGLALSGALSLSGSSSSGDTLSSPEMTGAILPSSGSLLSVETGSLIPIELSYADTDGNKKIDTLEILYPYALTGSVQGEHIFLFSRTGGLFSRKIDTETGYVTAGILSGNTLILSLREGDIEHDTLTLNASTSSDLRIKSLGDLGFRSVGGQSPEAFFLTKSFDEYRRVFRKTSFSSSGDISNTGTVYTGSSTTSSMTNTSGSSVSPLPSFPEIVPLFQSPTNALLSGTLLLCQTSECRVNISLEPMFGSGFPMKDFLCSFSTGSGFIIDADCNPNTWYFSSGTLLTLRLTHKVYTGSTSEKAYSLVFMSQSSSQSPSVASSSQSVDTIPPVAVLDHDGKWKEYFETVSDSELNCFTFTCSINFTAEKSYDPGGGELRYLWIWRTNDVSTTKDPGTRKYGIGTHVIILRAIDMAGNFDEKKYTLHVLGPKPPEKKEKKVAVVSEGKKIQFTSPKPEKKKIKKIRMLFFSPPELVLQGKKGEKVHDGLFLCEYKRAKSCAINFTLSGTTKGFEYVWSVDGKQVSKGKNPKSWKLTPGIHSITVASYRKNAHDPSHELSFQVKVVAEPKKAKPPKKAKKPKIPKTPKKSPVSRLPKIIEEAHAEDISPTSSPPPGDPISLLLFFSGVSGGYLIFLRRFRP